MKIGIDGIAAATTRRFISLEELAETRGIDPNKFIKGLGQEKMAIPEHWEDPVTLATEAAQKVLEQTGTDIKEIGRIVTATETSVDQSKPIATFVKGILDANTDCEVFQVQNACIGGTYALLDAVNWIRAGENDGKKALVIPVDIAKYHLNSPGEATQGAGAVALLVEKDPRILEIKKGTKGVFSADISDFWRPNDSEVAETYGKFSVEAYLHAQEQAYKNHFAKNGDFALLEELDHMIFHAPFSKMVKKAFEHLYKGDGLEKEIQKEWERKAMDRALHTVRNVGNLYTGSGYLSLLGLLESIRDEDIEGRTLGIGSYGSGCSSLFFNARIQEGAREALAGSNFLEGLERRTKMSIEEYEKIREGEEEVLYLSGLKAEGDEHYTLNTCAECHTSISKTRGLDRCPKDPKHETLNVSIPIKGRTLYRSALSFFPFEELQRKMILTDQAYEKGTSVRARHALLKVTENGRRNYGFVYTEE